MPRRVDVSDLSPLLRSRQDLLAHDWTERAIERAVREGRLRPIRRGWYLATDDWSGLWPEGAHLAHVLAVARDSRGGAVMSHLSAAVLWGLPVYRAPLQRVHMTVPPASRISSGPDVWRHTAPLAAGDVVMRHGIRCTSLERTVFDVVRTTRSETAVACADAAERAMTLRGREWDLDEKESWRRALADRVDAATGARGIRQARRILALADGRAQLPGESVSRLQLVRLGFAVPDLQVRVPGPDGTDYFVDFALRDVRAFGEFDGEGKYTDEALRRGMSVEAVMLAEKRREDWIRGVTQWRLVRWGDEHCATPAKLAARLRSFGVVPPR